MCYYIFDISNFGLLLLTIITYLKLIAKFFDRLTKADKILLAIVFVALAANFLLMKQPILIASLLSQNKSQPGGPITTANLAAVFDKKITNKKEQGVSSDTGFNGFRLAEREEELAGFALIESSAFLSAAGPLQDLRQSGNLMIYEVKKGDTLSEIAESFGVSVNTLIWANKNLSSRSLKPGQEIILLPVSGVMHTVSKDQTLESIAKLYKTDIEKIKKYNDVDGVLAAGTTLIIPGAKPLSTTAYDSSDYSNLPKKSGYFIMPTNGWNWGQLHPNNAVDIANSCGTPVYASAEGLVIEVDGTGYNSGYGQFIEIEHPNKTSTLYAHLSKILVSKGKMVEQGEIIGYIGNTGKVHGYSGCHLHFEVHGAQNPFAKY